MARRITEKEQAKWEAKGIARAQKWIDEGIELERVGFGMVNLGFNYQVIGNTFELRVFEKFPRTRLIATFTK